MVCFLVFLFWVLCSIFVAILLKIQKRIENKPLSFDEGDFLFTLLGPISILLFGIFLLGVFSGKRISSFLDNVSDKIYKIIEKIKEMGDEN